MRSNGGRQESSYRSFRRVEFPAWYRSGPADVGIWTRAALAGTRSGTDLADRAAA